MRAKHVKLLMVGASVLVVLLPTPGVDAHGGQHASAPVVSVLTKFSADGCAFGCGSGSTVGPDKALYVTDGAGGRVLRVDPRNGATSVFAAGLPPTLDYVGIGGAMDVVFLGSTAYALVSVNGPDVGGPSAAGIYRLDPHGSPTLVADLGQWSVDHPPVPAFFIPGGVQYAIEAYRGGFLVTDGHHNRVLGVDLDGTVREIVAYGDEVPTGIEVQGRRVFITHAGPIPHLAENGRVVSVDVRRSTSTVVATGARLLVDVEAGPGGLYALSQGSWDWPVLPDFEGFPASPNTGSIVRVDKSGGMTTVVIGLDQPTSFEFIGDRAFVVTLSGAIQTVRMDSNGH